MHKAGARAADIEAKRASRGRIRWHNKSNERAGQGRLEGRVQNETEGREGRKKVNTGSMDKQRAGRRAGQGHNISTSKAEVRTEGEKGGATGVQWQSIVEGKTGAGEGETGARAMQGKVGEGRKKNRTHMAE